MTYSGFEINDLNYSITKNGKPVFHGRFTAPVSLQDAKNLIDASNMAKEVLAKFPNLSKIDLAGVCELEAGTERDEEAGRWMDDQAEKQLNENI